MRNKTLPLGYPDTRKFKSCPLSKPKDVLERLDEDLFSNRYKFSLFIYYEYSQLMIELQGQSDIISYHIQTKTVPC